MEKGHEIWYMGCEACVYVGVTCGSGTARELARYKSDLVTVLEVRWDIGAL
jgi:hypothetical protein